MLDLTSHLHGTQKDVAVGFQGLACKAEGSVFQAEETEICRG